MKTLKVLKMIVELGLLLAATYHVAGEYLVSISYSCFLIASHLFTTAYVED